MKEENSETQDRLTLPLNNVELSNPSATTMINGPLLSVKSPCENSEVMASVGVSFEQTRCTGVSNNNYNNNNNNSDNDNSRLVDGAYSTNVVVQVKQKYVKTVFKNIDRISILFGVKYMFIDDGSSGNGSTNRHVSGGSSFTGFIDEAIVYIYFQQHQQRHQQQHYRHQLSAAATATTIDNDIADLSASLQNYIDSLLVTEAEDSSYDSECDADDSHEQVSRTTSDTLGQEFAEYVNSQSSVQTSERLPSYTQRVEFALKLGYTERLVQAALARLGPNPAQNELLAELIKLGAHQGNKADLCDPNTPDYGLMLNGIDGISLSSGKDEDDARHIGLRPIVIDGSNVAFCHGNKEVFSCLGIRLCVDWFRNRGHREITVFVPKFRKESPRPDNPIKDQEILFELEKERMLVYTPSRFVGGKRTVCYDDRYILKLASENDGIVVSNDNYRDLTNESAEFKRVVEERVLMYSFVTDRFMPPDDPLGRSGPTLDNFLRTQSKKSDPSPPCPYGKKCTYGNKCKFYHPERGIGPHKSVTERLSEHAARHLSARNFDSHTKTALHGKSLSVPLSSNLLDANSDRRKPLARTRSCAHEGCNPTHCNELPQKQRFGSVAGPTAHNNISAWSDYGHQMNEAKSHSIENVPKELYFSQQAPGDSQHGYGTRPSMQNPQSSTQCAPSVLHYAFRSGPHQSSPDDNHDGINLHQKLQRQLSLNPTGCDPRIFRIQNSNAIKSQPTQPEQKKQHQKLSNIGGHRLLAPSLSGPRTHMTNHWDLHQNVTRIASAPDPSRTWQSTQQAPIPSESHLWLQHNSTNVPQSQQNIAQTSAAAAAAAAVSTQVNRLHIQYHLSSIFPEEQVLTVMQMYPEETNPQNICAAILSMFPKM